MLTSEKLNQMWRDALNLGDPTAGNAHIRFARAIETETIKAHQRDMEAAVLAEREACAQLCFDNSEELGRMNGRTLAPFDHECQGMHAGMTYAKYIRARTQTMRTNDAQPVEVQPLLGATEALMEWCVNTAGRWDHPAYHNALRAVEAMRKNSQDAAAQPVEQLDKETVGWLYRGIAPHTNGKWIFREERETHLETRWWEELGQVYLETPSPGVTTIPKGKL